MNLQTGIKGAFLASLISFASTSASAQSILYPQHFDLAEVTLTDGPLKTAMETNDNLLLQYDADRLMAPFIRQAGLHEDKNSKYYGWLTKHPSFSNWGLSDWSLEGHVGGHYLTALAMAYASSNDEAMKAKLKERLDYCVAIMKDCQDAYANNTDGMKGFIGGQPINNMWKSMYKGDLNPFWKFYGWVPFYCQHKVMAGLRDAYVYAGNEDAKQMFKDLCDWTIELVGKYPDIQNVLGSEHGGVNETLADAYKIFGTLKYFNAAKKYSHATMIDNMQNGYSKSFLDGKHANTQVPKYIGFERVWQVANDNMPSLAKTVKNYRIAAHNFWQNVTDERTVCIGGNSVDEHFLAKSNASNYISNLNGPESCNTNNMLKLSEALFDETHDIRYADFYEQAMFNHILSTQDPKTGGYVYFTTLRPQGYKIYSQVNKGMWCCVGTGMENHGKYGHFIYTRSLAKEGSEDKDTVFVNLFVASELNAEKYGIKQETQFPYEQASKLTVTKGNFTLAVRKPNWVEGGGKYVYSDVKAGDVVNVDLPMTLRIEECPNLPQYIAFKYGPILLGAKTTAATAAEAKETGLTREALKNEYGGEGRMDHAPGSMANSKSITTSPLLICNRNDVLSFIKEKDLSKLQFTISGPKNVANADKSLFNQVPTLTLEPFFNIHHARYCIYWYQQSLEDYAQSDMAKEEAIAALLNSRTIDYVGTGEQQSEAGHAASYSQNSTKGSYNNEFYRDAQNGGYIQYTLNTNGESENITLLCRYTSADAGRKGTIYINGKKLADVELQRNPKNKEDSGFYNEEYSIPSSMLKGKKTIIFKIAADKGTICPGLYYVRLLRSADAVSVQSPRRSKKR